LLPYLNYANEKNNALIELYLIVIIKFDLGTQPRYHMQLYITKMNFHPAINFNVVIHILNRGGSRLHRRWANLQKTLINWKQSNEVGCVVVGGIPTLIIGLNSASCLQNLNWPSLHTRRSYFAIALVHDILHKKSPFHSILTSSLETIIPDPIPYH